MLQEAPSPLALFHALSIPYELRRSFMPLTSAHVAVVQALMDAAQAHVQGDVVLANALFTQADEPSMADYVLRIIGKIDVVIHRQARTPEAALLIAKALQARSSSSRFLSVMAGTAAVAACPWCAPEPVHVSALAIPLCAGVSEMSSAMRAFLR